jgi:pimeloyl-ACP methyl ester carboxylesterase
MISRLLHYAVLLLFLFTPRVASAASTDDRVTSGVPKGFESNTADLGGVKIHYVVGGEGPPLLLVHGWPETWYSWRLVMPQLAEHYTVIAPDMRGFGDSSLESSGYDKKTLAQDLHTLMTKLGFPKADLVGHDWGGPVAYAYTAQFRDAVGKLILIEGSPFGPWTKNKEPFWFFRFMRLGDNYPEALIAGRERQFLSYFYANDQFHVVPAFPPAVVDLYVRAFARPGRMQPSYALYRTIDQDVKDNAEFAKMPLTIPVLAIGARRGAGEFSFEGAKAVATNVTPLIFEETGHFIAEERPQALAGIIRSFLLGEAISSPWRP